MELRPFKELIAMSKEKLNETMAPVRAKMVKSQANLEMAELEGKILTLETEAQELCIVKSINFPLLFDKLDEIALLGRRQEQYNKVLGQLFPEQA